MTLPFLISVPHAGLQVPQEVSEICVLNAGQIARDGDEGAAEIYHPLRDSVAAFVTTDVARAVVDLNRAEDDFRKDGVIKTHTCWEVPVYREYPSEEVIRALIEKYHRPYHAELRRLSAGLRLGVDCHTMAAKGPPVGPDPGRERHWVCLSDSESLPGEWMDLIVDCFSRVFGRNVSVNDPFKGGYIIRSHVYEIPWLQLELSRAPFMTDVQKSQLVLQALRAFDEAVGG